MPIQDFKASFMATFTSPDVRNWQHSYFLSLDREIGQPGTHSWCGPSCHRNSFTVYSPEDQLVYLSAHLHPKRSYVEHHCKRQCVSCSTVNILQVSVNKRTYHFKEGARWLEPFSVSAGSTFEVHLELDFQSAEITKDFSIVMWADKAATTITHNEGYESDHYPHYEPPQVEETEPEQEETFGGGEPLPDEVLDMWCSGEIEI